MFRISIHAPSRERHVAKYSLKKQTDFNPRSLTGATTGTAKALSDQAISIHAPLRERQKWSAFVLFKIKFQSTLPCGSDKLRCNMDKSTVISIHAPLRERRRIRTINILRRLFQSTLPCGSDIAPLLLLFCQKNFNPRSLAGATFVNPLNLL